MDVSDYRTEKDSLGDVKVPNSALWGAQTQRSKHNFQISSRRLPDVFIRALVEIKRACAISNNELGIIAEDVANAIVKAADEVLDHGMHLEHFPLDVYQTGSGTQTNMNANEVLSNRAIQIMDGTIGSKSPVHPNDHVNKGQSSNDVIPTAMHLSALAEINKTLIPSLNKLIGALSVKVIEFKAIVKIGRTHLQDAVPLTLGQEFSGYVSQLTSARNHLMNSVELLEFLAIGGTAVGTGLNAHPDLASKVCNILSRRYDLKLKSDGNKFSLIATKDSLVAVSGALKTLAVSLMKIANDIRLLASGPRAGLGELLLPENEPGSSIMPGKINPTQCEMLTQVGAQVIGNDATVTIGGLGSFMELNVMKPVIISNILESIEILSNGMRSFTDHAVVGLKADEERINELVEKSLMLVTALTSQLGYDKAAKLAKQAYVEGKTIREVVLENNLMTEDDLNQALDLSKMVTNK